MVEINNYLVLGIVVATENESELTANVWYLHKWWACVKGRKGKEGKGERKHIALRIGLFNISLISTFLIYNPG